MLVVEVDGVHELAVDIELQLVVGAVPEPDGPRAAVAVEVIQGLFSQVLASVYPVHELQRPVGLGPPGVIPAIYEPFCLFCEPDAQEPVEGECRVPDPGVAVVPVALSADAFGQSHGGAATIAPVGSKVSNFRVRAERRTISRQRPCRCIWRASGASTRRSA